jgi:hypothetical protein
VCAQQLLHAITQCAREFYAYVVGAMQLQGLYHSLRNQKQTKAASGKMNNSSVHANARTHNARLHRCAVSMQKPIVAVGR